jgi:aerobic carbon-monoxide dehydrogenase large subunit
MTQEIGSSRPRREDAALLRGAGTFVDDVHLDNMAFAYVVRSQKSHGKIRKITTDVAASMPGVLSVLTADGLSLSVIRPRIAAMPNFDKFLQLPLATDKVRYVGEPVAVVVAESPYQAEDAASLVEVEIEDLPPISLPSLWRAVIGE